MFSLGDENRTFYWKLLFKSNIKVTDRLIK